jgi:hypothetical protein
MPVNLEKIKNQTNRGQVDAHICKTFFFAGNIYVKLGYKYNNLRAEDK